MSARCLGVFFQVGGFKGLQPLLKEMYENGTLDIWSRAPVKRFLDAKGYKSTLVTSATMSEASLEKYEFIISDTINMSRSEDGFLIGLLWELAARKGIPTVGFVDSWWGYDNRFISPESDGKYIYPKTIAVVDDIAREEMIRTGHNAEALAVLGSPHLDALRRKRFDVDDKATAFRKRLGLSSETFACLFVSQPLEKSLPGGAKEWGFNEMTTLKAIAEQVQTLPEEVLSSFELLILPHPEDDIEELRSLASNLCFKTEILEGYDPIDAVCGSDLVCGMFSMLLTEAVLLNKIVLSVQLGLKREDMLITNIVQATYCARTLQDLNKYLHNMICNNEFREETLAKQKRFTVVGNSLARWKNKLKTMSEELQ